MYSQVADTPSPTNAKKHLCSLLIPANPPKNQQRALHKLHIAFQRSKDTAKTLYHHIQQTPNGHASYVGVPIQLSLTKTFHVDIKWLNPSTQQWEPWLHTSEHASSHDPISALEIILCSKNQNAYPFWENILDQTPRLSPTLRCYQPCEDHSLAEAQTLQNRFLQQWEHFPLLPTNPLALAACLKLLSQLARCTNKKANPTQILRISQFCQKFPHLLRRPLCPYEERNEQNRFFIGMLPKNAPTLRSLQKSSGAPIAAFLEAITKGRPEADCLTKFADPYAENSTTHTIKAIRAFGLNLFENFEAQLENLLPNLPETDGKTIPKKKREFEENFLKPLNTLVLPHTQQKDFADKIKTTLVLLKNKLKTPEHILQFYRTANILYTWPQRPNIHILTWSLHQYGLPNGFHTQTQTTQQHWVDYLQHTFSDEIPKGFRVTPEKIRKWEDKLAQNTVENLLAKGVDIHKKVATPPQTPKTFQTNFQGWILQGRLLETLEDYTKEGANMHHCVATYFPRHARPNNTYRIYHITATHPTENPVDLTLERSDTQIIQIQGPRNTKPPFQDHTLLHTTLLSATNAQGENPTPPTNPTTARGTIDPNLPLPQWRIPYHVTLRIGTLSNLLQDKTPPEHTVEILLARPESLRPFSKEYMLTLHEIRKLERQSPHVLTLPDQTKLVSDNSLAKIVETYDAAKTLCEHRKFRTVRIYRPSDCKLLTNLVKKLETLTKKETPQDSRETRAKTRTLLGAKNFLKAAQNNLTLQLLLVPNSQLPTATVALPCFFR
jgi:hypothetical protein